MKNNTIWLALIAVALIAGIAFGLALSGGSDDVAGVYQAYFHEDNEFTVKDAILTRTLVLKEDGTGYLDEYELFWHRRGSKIEIEYSPKGYMDNGYHTLEIVSDNALRIWDDFSYGYGAGGTAIVFYRVG
jgi:hypothetical protein